MTRLRLTKLIHVIIIMIVDLLSIQQQHADAMRVLKRAWHCLQIAARYTCIHLLYNIGKQVSL